ncbi:MAG: hypothetical protein MJ175_04400 [Clostridia bacterium]|nr:hypothetical protein [Clostridia bacterium]
MIIRVAIIDPDLQFKARFTSAFSARYPDNIEVRWFTDPSILSGIMLQRVNLLLVEEGTQVDVTGLPANCAFAYLTEDSAVTSISGSPAICKYQRIDTMYASILALSSEKAGNIVSGGKNTASVLVFASPAGGCGSSSMAAAAAMRFARNGKRVLYLSLCTFSTSGVFFKGPAQSTMTDVIYAMKEGRGNVSMKLQSCFVQDDCGVYFCPGTAVALDMLELTTADKRELIRTLCTSGGFDCIIVDMEYAMDKDTRALYRDADALIWTGNGSIESGEKLARAFRSLEFLEEREDRPLTDKLFMCYSGFSSIIGVRVPELESRVLGGSPRYEHAPTAEVLKNLSYLSIFDKLL